MGFHVAVAKWFIITHNCSTNDLLSFHKKRILTVLSFRHEAKMEHELLCWFQRNYSFKITEKQNQSQGEILCCVGLLFEYELDNSPKDTTIYLLFFGENATHLIFEEQPKHD
jgi:hypothetical protein